VAKFGGRRAFLLWLDPDTDLRLTALASLVQRSKTGLIKLLIQEAAHKQLGLPTPRLLPVEDESERGLS